MYPSSRTLFIDSNPESGATTILFPLRETSNYSWDTLALEHGISLDDTALVVDFAEVPYLSSAGLRVLLTTAKQFDQPGRAFAICQLPRTVRKVLASSGFDRVVTVYDSEAEAVAAITGDGAANA